MKNSENKNPKIHERTVIVTEGAAFVALGIILSFFKINVGIQGGSINFTMLPLILYSLRRGAKPGFIASFAFGILKFALGGEIIAWQSIVFDYVLAYGFVGFAFVGRFFIKKGEIVAGLVGTLAGALARYAVHFVSGITIYAEYMPDVYMNMNMKNTALYSFLYNGVYMLPSTVVCLIVVPILFKVISLKFKTR